MAVLAQGKKPSQAWRQVEEQEKRLLETFDNDLSAGKAQPFEWDERMERLKAFAAERAAQFKASDWIGDELLALATLCRTAEMFPQAVEAYRAYLVQEPRAARDPNVVTGLTRALIETEQFAEAEKQLDRMEGVAARNPVMAVSRVSLHRDLAVALRDRGSQEPAAYQARKGYQLADSFLSLRDSYPQLNDSVQRDQMILAALAVASFERAGKKKEAEDLARLIEKYDFKQQPALKSRYEAELASARLIGSPAPELVAARWLDSNGIKLAELRGKVALLDFWAMWCSACVAAYPHYRDYLAKYAARGIEVIGVTRFYGRSDAEDNLSREQELKSLQNFKLKHKMTWPFAVAKLDDVTNDDRYGVAAMPTAVLIDRRGNVRHIKRGTGDYRKLAKQIEKLLDENDGK
ncbi:MAG: redoxin domain-containing protein [Blastocatellia bacterium]